MTRGAYQEFEASELYCPKCGRAMPVRKRLLLALPEGDKFDYVCSQCGSPVGSKLDKSAAQGLNLVQLAVPGAERRGQSR